MSMALAFETLPILTDEERADFGAAIQHRRMDTVQHCAYCGTEAPFSYVAHTMDPPRWLDLCGSHALYWYGHGPL